MEFRRNESFQHKDHGGATVVSYEEPPRLINMLHLLGNELGGEPVDQKGALLCSMPTCFVKIPPSCPGHEVELGAGIHHSIWRVGEMV